MTEHAYLSASSAHRWLNCTASPSLEEGYGDSSSIYAQEGTLAHAIAERKLLGVDYEDLTEDDLYDQSMESYTDEYVNYCLEAFNEARSKDPLAVMLTEERLDFSSHVPGGFGTGDCVIIGNGSLEIVDLKYGKGVEVDAVNNPQLMLYAWGAYSNLSMFYENISSVKMTVAQVRKGGISSFTMDLDDLKDWMDLVVKPRASEAYEGKGTVKPGDWCGFCKFSAKCKARAQYFLEVYEKCKKEELSQEEIAQIVLLKKDMEKWIKDITENALEEALQGVTFPGLKLVEGRSNRVIADKEELAERLKKKGYKVADIYKPREIKGLTDLGKLVGPKKLDEVGEGLIVKPEGKPTLVSVDDKRPEINTALDDFDFE